MEYIIGRIKGINKNSFILEKEGIGYCFLTPKPNDFSLESDFKVFVYKDIKLDKTGKIIVIYCGFKTKLELDFFSFLLNIKGIGIKTSLNILQNPLSEIFKFLKTKNAESLSRLSGFTNKNAEIIISEVSKVLDKKEIFNDVLINENLSKGNIYKEIEEALKYIGYNSASINKAIFLLIENKCILKDLNDGVNQSIKFISSN